MSSISIAGDTSGSVTLAVPAAAGSGTITLPAGTGTAAVQGVSTNIVSGTAVASTSGTTIDFTGIPSWVKRITVMFNVISTSGTSLIQVQVGNGSFVTTGYASSAQASTTNVSSTTGLLCADTVAASDVRQGVFVIMNITGNTWIWGGTSGTATVAIRACAVAGSIALSGVLDRVRVTTVNGTDTFDAGSINIMYE